jgi:ribosomal protein S24E
MIIRPNMLKTIEGTENKKTRANLCGETSPTAIWIKVIEAVDRYRKWIIGHPKVKPSTVNRKVDLLKIKAVLLNTLKQTRAIKGVKKAGIKKTKVVLPKAKVNPQWTVRWQKIQSQISKEKDTFADSSQREDSSMQSSSPRKGKGKPSKQDRDSARGPSGREDTEQFQSNSTHEENIQVAKIEKDRGKGKLKGSRKSPKKNREQSNQESAPSMAPMEQELPSELNQTQKENIQVAKIEKDRGKGRSKSSGEPQKMKRNQRKQQNETTAAVPQQEPAPSMAPSQPTTTASIAPSVFDNNQRSIIQSYFKQSSSKRSGKGRGKKSKRNKTSSIAKNDILTQSTEPLPLNLESQLPPPPPNTHRALYNQQVLLIEQETNRVLDVINVNN